MKRKRNAGQVIDISSDSDPEEQAAIDSEEEETDSNSDCDDDEDAEDEDDADDDYDDDSVDEDDEDDTDYDEIDEDYDDDTEDTSDDDDGKAVYGHNIPSTSERVSARNERRKASHGFYVAKLADSHNKGNKNGYKQMLKKGCWNAHATTLSSEDSKWLSEALRMIREGDLEELKSEHCKAYLRHHSLRLTGSRTTLLDRVREHVELKASDGMAKYPKSTFTINCTGDACTGDVVLFRQKVKNYKNANMQSQQLSWVTRVVAGRIVKESYGSDKQQHTFTVEVLWSKGRRALPLLYPLLIKGRNLYRMKTYRQRWTNEDERKRVLEEKHSRGDIARSAREDRVSGKAEKRANQKKVLLITSKRQQMITSKRQQTSGSQSSIVRRHRQEKETLSRAAVGTRVISAHRDYEASFCETWRTTMSTLRIRACFAGFLIGPQGRNVGAIERASGAKLHICNDPMQSDARLVEISGLLAEVQAAIGMVMKSFLDRGLPAPVMASQPSGSTL